MAKEAYYFSHDSNARRDPKILAMRNEFGNQGYGWYWILVEMLSEQEEYKLKHTKWVTNAIAMEMLCDTNEAELFVHSCIEDYELFESDGEHFWSESLLRRMNLKEAKRQKRVEAGKKGAQSRWSNDDSVTTPKQPDSNAIAKDGKGKERKVNESKEKESNKDIVADALPYKEVIDYLNVSASTQFRSNGKKTQSVIKARFNEGFTLDDFKTVIDKKTADWLNDEKWSKFLRPETLFGNKFEGYLNEKRGGSRETFKQPVARTNDTSGLDW